jgi:DNA-binding IclR family transcriptional regulator
MLWSDPITWSNLPHCEMHTVAVSPGSRTIERALSVLDAFTVTRHHWRTTSLAEHCGLPVPTTHRILRMLERFGYVSRDPQGAYSLGPSAQNLARRDSPAAELGSATRETLRGLHRATGERVVLAALSASRDHGCEICAIDARVDGDALDAPLAPRTRPLHAGAPAKVLLAELGRDEVARVIDRGLAPVGPATITKPLRLRRELAAIRRRGWAFSREETMPRRWALAVPVRNSYGPACALAISAPLERFDRDRARRHLAVLKLAARPLGERLSDEVEELAAA